MATGTATVLGLTGGILPFVTATAFAGPSRALDLVTDLDAGDDVEPRPSGHRQQQRESHERRDAGKHHQLPAHRPETTSRSPSRGRRDADRRSTLPTPAAPPWPTPSPAARLRAAEPGVHQGGNNTQTLDLNGATTGQFRSPLVLNPPSAHARRSERAGDALPRKRLAYRPRAARAGLQQALESLLAIGASGVFVSFVGGVFDPFAGLLAGGLCAAVSNNLGVTPALTISDGRRRRRLQCGRQHHRHGIDAPRPAEPGGDNQTGTG